ncbi:hypothetical protein [Shewanella sp.]
MMGGILDAFQTMGGMFGIVLDAFQTMGGMVGSFRWHGWQV